MKLSSSYLGEQLSRRFEILHQSGISKEDGYLRPYLCADAEKDRPGHVCVHPFSRTEPKPEILSISAGDSLVISCDASITFDLLNLLQEIFDCSDDWERQTGYHYAPKEEEKSNAALESVFEKILSDRMADYMQMSRLLSAEGWQQEHSYLCLVLEITYLNQQELTEDMLCRYIRDQLPDSCSFRYRDEIVSFFNLSLLGLDSSGVESALNYFIQDNYLKAGYSRTMEGHMNLRRQYVQAQLALEVGSRKDPYLWIHYFNQIALTHILEQATRRLPADMLCHEGLLRLKETDEKNHTEYVRTLRTWLDVGMNATQCASKLFIHRSTFLYRLDRIKEILRSDLKEPEEIFYIALSIRLLES